MGLPTRYDLPSLRAAPFWLRKVQPHLDVRCPSHAIPRPVSEFEHLLLPPVPKVVTLDAIQMIQDLQQLNYLLERLAKLDEPILETTWLDIIETWLAVRELTSLMRSGSQPGAGRGFEHGPLEVNHRTNPNLNPRSRPVLSAAR